jgi:sodium-dependent dicarboxylate transporter 2/3/5
MMAATMAASCGFMMPAGTPPNTIAFGTGHCAFGIWSGRGLCWMSCRLSSLLASCILWDCERVRK